MKKRLNNIILYIKRDLWSSDDAPLSAWIVRQIRCFVISIRNSYLHRTSVSSGALTFYTLTSLVPVLALIFAISKGFGIEARIINYIRETFSTYDSLVDYLTQFANVYLENSRIGLLAGVGLVVLVWSVVKVFSNIEGVFNTIWGVKRQRNLYRKVTDYLAIVICIPILLFIYTSLSGLIESGFNGMVSLGGVLDMVLFIVNKVIFFMIFAFAYTFLPNTKVKFSAAFYGAIITGTAYLLFESAYIYFQSSITTYSAVYGSFAALPLFLIWLNISWNIMLFGAELSYAYQNLSDYEYRMQQSNMTHNFRRKLTMVVLANIIKEFTGHRAAPTSSDLATKIGVAQFSVREALQNLEKCGVVTRVKYPNGSFGYLPSYDQSEMRINDLNTILDSEGIIDTSHQQRLGDSVNNAFSEIEISAAQSKGNIKIKDL